MALKRFLERENTKKRLSIPLERPEIRTITSGDAIEKVSIGVHSNGVTFMTLRQRDALGRYQPVRVWRREFDPHDVLNRASGKARAFLEARAQQRAKEFKLAQR